MAESRKREEWNHTASLMALIANCNRDSKKRRKPFEPKDFHPDTAARDEVLKLGKTEGLAALKAVFVDRKLPKGVES